MPSEKDATVSRRKSTSSTAAKEPKTKKPKVDTTIYEMEKITKAQAYGNGIEYQIKWWGYPESDNTFEQDVHVLGRSILLQYAGKNLDDRYADFVNGWMDNLNKMGAKKFVENLNPLSVIAENWLLGGNVLFMNNDSIGSKKMFLNALKKYKQTFSLHTIVLTSHQMSKEHAERWRDEYTIRASKFTDYPDFRLSYTKREEWGPITAPPPPLSSLIFETFTEKEMKTKENVIAPASDEAGFLTSKPFLSKTYLDSIQGPEAPPLQEGSSSNQTVGVTQNRFAAKLILHFDPKETKWIVLSATDIPQNTALLKMCGVIRDTREAHRSFVEEGERIAFSSFIRIQGTDKVLDRRQYYDLSKFVGHSCTPTCEVRLVENGTDIPDVVVFSRADLKKLKHRLTIDYFECFKDDVDAFFDSKETFLGQYENGDDRMFYCYDHDLDFVYCNCESPRSCKKILYVDKSRSASRRDVSKAQKLRDMPLDFKFHGLELAENNTIYQMVIQNPTGVERDPDEPSGSNE